MIKEEWVKNKMEADFVESLDAIPKSNIPWSKKMIRFNTSLLYKQQKFNLLREESEGYSKLIVEVEKRVKLNASEEWMKSVLDIVNSLVGILFIYRIKCKDFLIWILTEPWIYFWICTVKMLHVRRISF